MPYALKCTLSGLLLLFAADACAQLPGLATCTRSANLLACVDADGNAYSVNTVGSTIYLRGFEADYRSSISEHLQKLLGDLQSDARPE